MSGSHGAKSPEETRDLKLRMEARMHDGVIRVPFLGSTWQKRGAAYWWRRVGAVVVLLLALAMIGGITTALTIAVFGNGHNPIRVALIVAWDLTAIFGVRFGLRSIAAAPLRMRTPGPRYFFPGIVFALAMAAFTTGLTLTMLIAMLRRDAVGERSAREAMERFASDGIVLTTPKPPHPRTRR